MREVLPQARPLHDQPWGDRLACRGDQSVDLGTGKPPPSGHLGWVDVDDGLVLKPADEDMAQLVLGAARIELGLVLEPVGEGQLGVEAQLLAEATVGGRKGLLPLAGMTATTVGPEEGPEGLGGAALLKQDLTTGADDEDGKGPMEDPGAAMDLSLAVKTDNVVLVINEDQWLVIE